MRTVKITITSGRVTCQAAMTTAMTKTTRPYYGRRRVITQTYRVRNRGGEADKRKSRSRRNKRQSRWDHARNNKRQPPGKPRERETLMFARAARPNKQIIRRVQNSLKYDKYVFFFFFLDNFNGHPRWWEFSAGLLPRDPFNGNARAAVFTDKTYDGFMSEKPNETVRGILMPKLYYQFLCYSRGCDWITVLIAILVIVRFLRKTGFLKKKIYFEFSKNYT